MKIIEENHSETVLFKIDYKSIPELLAFSKENHKYEDWLDNNELEYRCIKDADNTMQPAYYVFFGFETYHDLYEQGCWGDTNATDLRHTIEQHSHNLGRGTIERIKNEVRFHCGEEKLHWLSLIEE